MSIFDVAVEIVLDFFPGEMRDVVVGSAMEACNSHPASTDALRFGARP